MAKKETSAASECKRFEWHFYYKSDEVGVSHYGISGTGLSIRPVKN